MRTIARGDVRRQAMLMTDHMRAVMLLVEEGVITYGRGIARELKVPFPQAYNTLNNMHARGFMSWEYGDPDRSEGTRKLYALTDAGHTLLDTIRTADLPQARREKTSSVDPDAYARRMKASRIARWLQELGLVESYDELVHVSTCPECTRLIKQYGLHGDMRCVPYVDSLEGIG